MEFDFSKLTQTLIKRGVREESVRPVMMLSLYSEVSLHKLGPSAATALRSYFDLIPNKTLRSAQLDNGDAGKLSPQRIARDLRHLDNPSKDEDIIGLLYSSAELGPPGDFGINFIVEDITDPDFINTSNLLRFEFPVSLAGSPEQMVQTALRLTEGVPFSVGTCGFGFSHWHGDRFAVDQVYRLLPRYLGFDHSSKTPREWIKGQTPSPNWLTFVHSALWEELGGMQALETHAPDAKVSKLKHGFVVQAAKAPPIGDVNRGGTDLGALPGVARFLKPKRTRIPFLRGAQVELDVSAWLSRFDDRDNQPWDNE
ncbi:DUF3396 domain-containing protein [Mesorhizobium sp. M0621]|uniref:type VI immunity family protein n=1 Tax=Mesorhizobium sp. M0621 TaxID=2956974 RepID=UPI0033392F67